MIESLTKTKVHVWYDASGRIIAVGRPASGQKATPLATANQSVLEAEIEEGLYKDLHRTHAVDVEHRSLTTSSSKGKDPA